ncbi:hypothetical protein H5410_009558 [Solanum commersonii]|uniref:Retrovirus-related Pol polyprotein from transposon TNT 1-94-like beta-barrel domain-containing protein n=1 Tax=Solanum commersonii TaxID=4109 RepID=A0A9J6AJ33_SOLCO|nr:hypothetical protein H5410_009558 [Solanum commersonii]
MGTEAAATVLPSGTSSSVDGQSGQGRNFQRSGNVVTKGNFPQGSFTLQRNPIPNSRGGRGNYKNKGRRNKRIGYPEDFEFTKSREFDPSKQKGFQGKANWAFPSENSEVQGMTQQQGTPSNIFYHLNKERCYVKFSRRDIKSGGTWIIDSGASEHMCFDSQFFISLTPLPVPLHITLPNSFRIIATHAGSVPILPNFTLENGHLMKNNQVFGDVRDGLYLLEHVSPKSKVLSKDVVSFPKGSNSISQHNSVSFQKPPPCSSPAPSLPPDLTPIPFHSPSIPAPPLPPPRRSGRVTTQYVSDLISLSFIPSVHQLADLFTKPLPGPSNQLLLHKLGVSSPPSNLRGDIDTHNSPSSISSTKELIEDFEEERRKERSEELRRRLRKLRCFYTCAEMTWSNHNLSSRKKRIKYKSRWINLYRIIHSA